MLTAVEAPSRSDARVRQFLVVEDNPKLADVIRQGLVDQTYGVEVTASGRDAEELAATKAYDAIILDVMLPDHDGLDLCRNLRRRGVATPVLILTALSTTADKIAGLDAGSDDYLVKPFELDELLARVRALLRRSPTEGVLLRFHDLEMDLVKRSVRRAGKSIVLTAREFALLEFFLRNPDRVLTRTTIGERIWDFVFEDESNVIEVYVSRLRSKIDRGFDCPLIHTVIGAGYRLSVQTPAA